MARKKKKTQVPIPEEKWNKWTSITCFFEDITGEKAFKQQKEFFEAVEDVDNPDHIILCCGRGCGKTWSLAIVALWYSFVFARLQNEPIEVAVLAGSKDESEILFKYLRRILRKHPEIDQYIAVNQKGGLRFLRDYLEFKDGSSIQALPCSLTGVCGPRANLLIIDEAGLEKFNEEVRKESFEIITGKKWGRIIMASTPYYYRSPFVKVYQSPKGWRRFHWGQEDCKWIRKEEIERKRQDYSEVEFRIRVQGLPTPQQDRMFNPQNLKKVFFDPKEIHYSDYSRIVAGIDWGQNIAKTALVIIEINPVDKIIRVVNFWTWGNPNHAEIIPIITNLLTQNQVSRVVMDAIPPNSCAMMKKALKHLNISYREQPFTHGQGDAMYHNLKRLVERELIQIPNFFTGKQDTLLEQMREMEWSKNKKKRTDLVDALALACSEEGGFSTYRSEQAKRTLIQQFKAWEDTMLKAGVKVASEKEVESEGEEEEEEDYPPELQGNPDSKIFWYDPVFGDMRLMTRKEAREIWKHGSGRRKPRVSTFWRCKDF